MIYSINHLIGILGYPKSEIMELINNIDSYYYEFSEIKYDSNGSPKIKNGVEQKRYYNPSKGKLRDIQNKLQRQILSKIPLLPNIKGGVKGNGNIDNAKVHKAKKFRFQTDLTNFFPSVSNIMVYKALRGKGFSKPIADIICKLTTFRTQDCWREKCLPQGAPTSPTLANIVFEKIDNIILNAIDGKRIFYTRWVDDLTFSSNEEIPNKLQGEILTLIGRSGLKVSKKKTTYRHNSSIITGVEVGMSTMKVTDNFRNKDESQMTELQKKGRRAYKEQIYKIDKSKKK